MPGSLFLALAAGALAFGQARVEGTVTNGTTGRPLARLEVRVLSPRGGMQEVATATTDATGHFAFSNAIDPKGFYLLSTNYQGTMYNDPLRLDPSGGAVANLTVYDSTASEQGLSMPACRTVVAAQGAKAQVQEQFVIENSTKPPRTYESPSGSFHFVIPPQAGTPQVAVTGMMNMQLPQTPEAGKSPGEFFIRYPLKPGQTFVTIQYESDYDSAGYAYHSQVPFPTDRAELYVYPPGLTVNSTLFKSTGLDSANNVAKYEADNLPRNAALDATLSGEPAAPSGSSASSGGVQVVPDTMTGLRFPILGAVLILLLWALGVRVAKEWTRWQKQRPGGPASKQFEAKAETLLNSLADLDELYAAGKVPERTYWKERLELKARLIALFKKSPPAVLESYAPRQTQR